MAQKVEIILLDDIDGTEADETIAFGLDGHEYEIDVNKKNADKIRKALAPFIEKGRRTKARRGRPKASAASASSEGTARTPRKRSASVEEIEAAKGK